jgi:hypothetical protein
VYGYVLQSTNYNVNTKPVFGKKKNSVAMGFHLFLKELVHLHWTLIVIWSCGKET